MSVRTLEELTRRAEREPWSATGRPMWVKRNKQDVRGVYLSIFGIESDGVYRGVIYVVSREGRVSFFSLDISFVDFDRLPTLTPGELIDLLKRLLASGEHVSVLEG